MLATADSQQGSTDEGDQRDDSTEARRAIVDGISGGEFVADDPKKNAAQRTSSEIFTQHQHGDGRLCPKSPSPP